MGFKCPLCFKDFKHDKIEWEKHCANAHKGIGKDIVGVLIKISEEKQDEHQDEHQDEQINLF